MSKPLERRDVLRNALLGGLGVASVLLHALAPDLAFEFDLGWVGGGVVVGSLLVAFQYATATGDRLDEFFDRSVAARVASLALGLVVMVVLVALADAEYDPVVLSGMLGLSLSWPVVALLYLRQ